VGLQRIEHFSPPKRSILPEQNLPSIHGLITETPDEPENQGISERTWTNVTYVPRKHGHQLAEANRFGAEIEFVPQSSAEYEDRDVEIPARAQRA